MSRQQWGLGGRPHREGIYVYLELIHADAWQKPAQHCKAIILQCKKRQGWGLSLAWHTADIEEMVVVISQKEKKVAEDEIVSITDSMDMNLSKLWKIVKDREAWHAAVHRVTKSQTRLSD